MSDPRFARIKTDPRFRKPRRKQNKIIVDERFKSVFENDEKKTRAKKVDKYGRKVAIAQETNYLKRFYRLEDDDGESKLAGPDYARGEALMESSSEEEYENDRESDSEAEDGIVVLGANARKPIPVPNEEPEIDMDESQFPELDALAESNIAKSTAETASANASGEQTNRLAVVNLDWDHVRAVHLYKIFASVLTPGRRDKGGPKIEKGKVLSVRIYPSQFGKERVERETREGPPKEIFKRQNVDEDDNVIEEDDGKEYDEEALRKYQLERLRYYYAIVTCDTVDTAVHIYSQLDGTELERSANVFDLSYVPNDMTFDEEFADEATQDIGTEYKGLEFSTDALRHSRVKLTWDDDDPERVKLTKRTLTKKEIEEVDFKAYIASSESEDEDTGEDKASKRKRLRNLLLGAVNEENGLVPEGWGGKDYDKAGEMEITFTPGLSAKNEIVNEEDETTMQRYLRKQREKRKKKKNATVEAEKAENRVEDEFFEDNSDKEEEELVKKGKGKTSKRHAITQPAAPRMEATLEELELLTSSVNPSNEPKHFDMKSILKAEKTAPKKSRKKDRKKLKEGEAELQEDFNIDVNDERFKALHEDHAYAIDPTNPHFKKTKSMAMLLEERTKRQGKLSQHEENTYTGKSRVEGDRSLNSLVESVKRKSAGMVNGGGGKRRKL